MKKLRHLFEYWIALAGAWLLQRLPLGWAQAFARLLGRGAFALGVARRISLENLRQAFPEKTEGERKRIASDAYAQFATTMIELAVMPAQKPAELAQCFDFQGMEIFDRLKAEGRGALCLSAHYGNWEWMGAALIARGHRLTFMIGTQSNPHTDALFNKLRAAVGIEFVRIREIREVIKALKAGRFLAVLGDQDGDKWGRFVRFFGRTACTHDFWLGTALRSNAALLFGVPQRLGPRSHRVKVHELPQPPEGLGEAQAAAFRLQAYNDLLEAAVREDPKQWLWMHNRWRSQPDQRLSDAGERARALSGEFVFDTARQAWADRAGNLVELKSWPS